MDQKTLKTSTKQRVFIAVIAVIMLGSMIASYAAIVASGNSSTPNNPDGEGVSNEVLKKYEAEYEAASSSLATASASNFNEFINYKSRIVAYNAASANSEGLQTEDLKIGEGRELVEGDTNYLAYYVGWCADEEIFDSTFDNTENPTSFAGIFNLAYNDPIMGAQSAIEGWNKGVVGMKLGGIREVTIPGELAYGEDYEICGAKNSPLKFLIMPVENSGEVAEAAANYSLSKTKLTLAYNYNIDYADLISEETEEQ